MALTATIKIKLRRGTLAEWISANPVLLHGEVGIIIQEGAGQYPISIYVGNGVDNFVTLYNNSYGVIRPFGFIESSVRSWFGDTFTPGDILAYNDNGEFERLPVGTTDQVLSIDTADPQPLKWIDLPVSGDMTKAVYDVDNDGIVDASEREQVAVINKTGNTLSKGTIVYLKSTSSSSNYAEVLKASATSEATSSKTIGAIYEDIADGNVGYVITSGQVHNLNTSAYSIGTKLWLSTTAGEVTSTPPTQPNHTVFIGTVTRSQVNNGRILYAIQNGYELNELHNVLISAPLDDTHVLSYDSLNGLWKNTNIIDVIGYTPADVISRAKTDGTTFGLSSFTPSDFNDNGSGVISIDYTNAQKANASQNGLLSSTDWVVFNSKQANIPTGTTAQYYRGDKTWQTLDKTAVGLSNVDNTSDVNKPISNAVGLALDNLNNAKQDNLVSGTNIKTIEGQSILGSGNIDLTKSDVGLSNVDNTSDANKPISTATQVALNGKEPTISPLSPAQTDYFWRSDKTWQQIAPDVIGLSNVDNTSDLDKPISTATQTALNAKQDTLTLTTTGTSGAATLIGSTLNIPQYGGGGLTQGEAIAYAIALG